MTFRTNFSFRLALGSPDAVVNRLKELGYSHAPISDVASTFGWVKWDEACRKAEIKPIFGVQIFVCEAIQAKKPIIDLFTFYAKDSIQPLNELVRKAYAQGRNMRSTNAKIPSFTPVLKYSDLDNLGNVIKVSGYRSRLELMNASDENLFVGISPSCAKGFVNRASDLGFKFFAVQHDQRFVLPEDRDVYQIHAGEKSDLKVIPQYILGSEEFASCFPWEYGTKEHAAFRHAVNNRSIIFEKATAKLEKASLIQVSSEKSLRELCIEGAAKRGIDLDNSEYSQRLDHELKVIESKKLEDYFLLVSDLMKWAKKNMAIGPGRGSSASSLVCYLLEITNINPLDYGLLFFRFLDEERDDAADIDLDLANFDLCFEYLINKYGSDRVAKLGAVGTFQAGASVNEVSKQLRFPRFEFDKLIESLPKYAAGDTRADKAIDIAIKETDLGQKLAKKYPGLEIAGAISGNPSNATTHAAGVLLTDEPLSKYVAVDANRQTAMVDLKDAEKLNLLKLDCLSLDTLSVFEKTLEIAGLPRDFLDTVPLDDQKAFDVVNQGKFTGLFQLSGHAVSGLTRKIKVSEFNDIVALSSFGRPGPMASGGAERWTRRRMGIDPVEYAHPLFEPYLKSTLGEFAYQEQLLLICHDLGNMSWGDANKLRKVIGKSQGPEAMRQYGEPFKEGLKSHGISQEIADKFWQDILGCGSYLFALAHAVPYGLMSYYSCYLKGNYPLEFAAAGLSLAKSQDKQISFLREMAAEGIGYVPFDIEISDVDWKVGVKDGKKILVAPISNVRGLGPKKIQQILGARARNEPIPDSIQKVISNAKTDLDSLNPIREAIQGMNWRAAVNGPVTRLDKATPSEGSWTEYTVIGLVTKAEEQSENDEKKVADRIARGQQGILPGDPMSIQIRLKSDEVSDYLCKVSAKQFDNFRDQVKDLEVGKTIVAIYGSHPPGIPCLMVKSINVIGNIE